MRAAISALSFFSSRSDRAGELAGAADRFDLERLENWITELAINPPLNAFCGLRNVRRAILLIQRRSYAFLRGFRPIGAAVYRSRGHDFGPSKRVLHCDQSAR